jgi:hypothetical protein
LSEPPQRRDPLALVVDDHLGGDALALDDDDAGAVEDEVVDLGGVVALLEAEAVEDAEVGVVLEGPLEVEGHLLLGGSGRRGRACPGR